MTALLPNHSGGTECFLSLLTWYVEDADLAKDGAIAKGDEHCLTVVSDHVKLASLDDVHLLADIAFPTDIVPGREHLQLQFQDQVYQQAFLGVLKDPNLL